MTYALKQEKKYYTKKNMWYLSSIKHKHCDLFVIQDLKNKLSFRCSAWVITVGLLSFSEHGFICVMKSWLFTKVNFVTYALILNYWFIILINDFLFCNNTCILLLFVSELSCDVFNYKFVINSLQCHSWLWCKPV